jgi:hypothetical protein
MKKSKYLKWRRERGSESERFIVITMFRFIKIKKKVFEVFFTFFLFEKNFLEIIYVVDFIILCFFFNYNKFLIYKFK